MAATYFVEFTKRHSNACSSTKVEYKSVASTVAALCWVQSLLFELDISDTKSPRVYCDNVGAIYLYSNHIFHSCMNHICIDFHFISDLVMSGVLHVAHVASANQLADLLTKSLLRSTIISLRSKIGVSDRPSILLGHIKDIS